MLYSLYLDVPDGLQPISAAFKSHIFEQGMILLDKIEKNEEGKENGTPNIKIKELLNESAIVEKLLALLEKYTKMVQ